MAKSPDSARRFRNWTPNNPVAQKLSNEGQSPAQGDELAAALTDLNAATAGFKNFGQFVAAVHASRSETRTANDDEKHERSRHSPEQPL